MCIRDRGSGGRGAEDASRLDVGGVGLGHAELAEPVVEQVDLVLAAQGQGV